jgi:plastocyanin
MPSRRTQQRFKLRSTSSSSRRWVGDTITWINKNIVAHTATVRGGFDVMIEANKSASWVLKKAGIVEYYCRFHPNMKGRITITPE